MAAKRVSKSAINWAELAERVPENQTSNLQFFKSKSDVYVRAVMNNPEKPPKINWAFYKKLIPNAALVDNFQQKYENFKVPYPENKVLPLIENETKEVQARIEEFKKNSNSLISSYEKKLGYVKSLLPYDQMTMEDFRDSFPDLALDPINRPTFWPHTADEQVVKKAK